MDIEKFLKFLGVLFWILIFGFIILWYSQNRSSFFPKKEEVKEIKNPINPFSPQ